MKAAFLIMLPALVAGAAVTPTDYAEPVAPTHRELQSSGVGVGTCFSLFIYQTMLNAASFARSEATSAAGEFINGSLVPSSGVIHINAGTRTMTLITLFVTLGVSLALLILGERLVNVVLIMTTAIASFCSSLYLFIWACSGSTEFFVLCNLPFILACLLTLIVTGIVGYFVSRFPSLGYFIMGAAGGAFGMLLLRMFILAGNPQLGLDKNFKFFWLGLAGVAILVGIIAVKLKKAVFVSVTSLLGGYGFAVSLCGLIPAFGGPIPVNYVFFIIFGFTVVIGALWQIFLAPKVLPCGSEEAKKRKQEEEFQGGMNPRNPHATNAPVTMVRP